MRQRLIGVLLLERRARGSHGRGAFGTSHSSALMSLSSALTAGGVSGGTSQSTTIASASTAAGFKTFSSTTSSSTSTFVRPAFDISESLSGSPSDHVIVLESVSSAKNNGKTMSKKKELTLSLAAGSALAPATTAAVLASCGSARLLAAAVVRSAPPGEGKSSTPLPSARNSNASCVVDYKERPYSVSTADGGGGSLAALLLSSSSGSGGGGAFSAAEADASAALSSALRCVVHADASSPALHVSCTLLSADADVDPMALALAAAPVAAAAAGVRVLAPLAPGRAIVVPSSNEESAIETLLWPDARERTDARADVLVALTTPTTLSPEGKSGGESRLALLDLRASEASPAAVASATEAATRAASQAFPALEAALRDASATAAAAAASPSLPSSSSSSRHSTRPPVVPDPAAMAALSSAASPHIERALEVGIFSSAEGGTNSNSPFPFAARAAALAAARASALADLRSRGAWRLNPMRQPGSGCVCPADVDAGFPRLVAEAVAARAARGLPRPGGSEASSSTSGGGASAVVGAWAPRGARDARDLGLSLSSSSSRSSSSLGDDEGQARRPLLPLPAAHGSAVGGVGAGTRVAAAATVVVDWRASGLGSSGGGASVPSGPSSSSSSSSDAGGDDTVADVDADSRSTSSSSPTSSTPPPGRATAVIGPSGVATTSARLRASVSRPPFASGAGGAAALSASLSPASSSAVAPASAFFGSPASLSSRASPSPPGGGGVGSGGLGSGSWWPDRRLSSWIERSLAGALTSGRPSSDAAASSSGHGVPPSVPTPFALRLSLDVLSSDGDPSGAALAAACRAMATAGAPMPREVGSAAGAALRVGVEKRNDGGEKKSDGADESDSWELLVDPDAIEASSSAASFNVSSTSKGWTAGRAEVWSPGSVGAPASSVVAEGLRAAGRVAAARAAAAAAAAPATESSLDLSRGRFGAVPLAKDQVGRVIGVGGSVSRSLEARTRGLLAVVDVDGGTSQKGSPTAAAASPAAAAEARFYAPEPSVAVAMTRAIESLTGADLVAGSKHRVKVVGVVDYGAFVEFPSSGFQALLHISEVARRRLYSVSEELEVGQEVDVVCTGRDARGLVQVSRKALLPPSPAAEGDSATAASPPPPSPEQQQDSGRRGRSSSFNGNSRSSSRSSGGSSSSPRRGRGGGNERRSSGATDTRRKPSPSPSSPPRRGPAPSSSARPGGESSTSTRSSNPSADDGKGLISNLISRWSERN